MGQVPHTQSIPLLLVGGGRLARHLGRYLELEGLAFDRWERSSPVMFETVRDRADRIVLLISDDAIDAFVGRYHNGRSRLWIHCSGSVSTPLAEAAHPLMAFGDELYDLATYRSVTFVTERARPAFDALFPGLGNPHVAIDPEDKHLYHAMCVLAGNGSTLLWQKAFLELDRMGLPREAILPFLDRVGRNLGVSTNPLTGPLVRGDRRTIQRNLDALQGDPFREVYLALIDAHRETP